ncbi:MAG: DUF3987 domain-containing protein [Phycisphaerae bacterium]|nr:DUF3987 domain-containing protein [Phycisphaerae bacterium]
MVDVRTDSTIRRHLELLAEPGGVFEIRAPGCREHRGGRYAFTASGYFTADGMDAAVAAVAELDRSAIAPGIYVTLNPVDTALLARATNRIKARARETTQDKDILGRRWLLVDVDPVRPTGVSATDAELALAQERSAVITEHLTSAGWPSPVVAMSGNGYHLLYRVDLPADERGLVKAVLAALADRFSDGAVAVDRAVHNPARIVKVIGTVSRKGDDLRGIDGLEDRPHRRSFFLEVPPEIAPVPEKLLQAVAGAKGGAEDATRANVAAPVAKGNGRFDGTPEGVRSWLEGHGVDVKGMRRNGDKTLLLLARCPINPEIVSTGGSDIAVLVGDDGKLAYCNKHSRGERYTWQDLRRTLDPDHVPTMTEHPDVDLSAFGVSQPDPIGNHRPYDPGPLPVELLRIPGFVSEVMDHCLATAPYPNTVMAFCGALALQAFLAGRRVRDAGDNRTNIYLLGLAHSAAGKDWPRKINTQIVFEVGLTECLGERFASGEGVQDALFVNPCMLFQTDEIDGMLQSINKAKDARHENVMSTLLTLYSAANSVFPMRRKAGKQQPGVIDQPNLVILGTAIPNHYYEALSERMLTNGFFARMIILESGPRSEGQEPRIAEIPDRVLETARCWSEFRPGSGNLQRWHPVPLVVDATDEATELLVATRREAEAEYARAEAAGDPVGTTVWGRAGEQVRKLALLHAVSENHRAPSISADAARWASRFVLHQTRRMLFMAAGHVAENPFHGECLKLLRKLREAPEGQMARNKLMRAMRCKLADFDQIVGTLLTQGDIVPVEIPSKTKHAQGYRLP